MRSRSGPSRRRRPWPSSSLSIWPTGSCAPATSASLDPDGYLSITGRIVDKLVVGGFNVYPAEVEDALRHCEHITDVVVVGLSDLRLGERPVAGVVWAGTASRRCRGFGPDLLAAYKLPEAVV